MKKLNAVKFLALITLMSTAMSTMVSTARAGEDGFELQSAVFKFANIVNPKTSSREPVTTFDIPVPPLFLMGNNGYAGASVSRDRIIEGKIVIKEYNDREMIQRTTIIDQVSLKMRVDGLTLGAKAYWNDVLELHNLKDKSIADIFDAPYSGWKGSLGVGVLLGLNPNYMSLSNQNGVILSDLESLIVVSGVGLQVLKIDAEFTTQSTRPIIEIVKTGQNSTPQSTKITLDALKNRRL